MTSRTIGLRMLLLFILLPASLIAQQLEIHVINVGWGASLFIKGPNGTTVLIEAGNTGKGTGRVVPYLQSLGIQPTNGLDYTIVGHQHSDHLGGMDEVIQAGYNVRIKNYYNGSTYSSTAVTDWNNAAATTTAGAPAILPVGTEILLGNGAKMTCVARNGSIIGGGSVAVTDENDRSIALLIQYGGFDFLWASDMGGGTIDQTCTGRSTAQLDVETSVIQAISPGGAAPKISSGGIDLLYSNHHGSESSTNMNWMNLSRPAVAVISVGDGQTTGWDLPRKDVVENVLLAQAASCITAPPAFVIQTEEGAPVGSLTSTAGYSVGNIKFATDGVSTFIVSADGQVTQGPNELVASGLPKTFLLDDVTAPSDTIPPVISNVLSSNITSSSATITWTTDETSNSVVEYGLTTAYGSTQSDATMVASHSVNLAGLTASTLYHYRVKSSDAAGNTATSGDFTFTTTSTPPPPTGSVVISEVFYDTPGTDAVEEWVELYNGTSSSVDISGWTLRDDNGFGATYTIPAGKTIAPGTFFTIAADQVGFRALYGYDADLYGAIPALNNTGDALVLKNASGAVIDAVGWEGGATNGVPAGWGSATDPNAPMGSSIVRTNPTTDTNTYADWSVAANNGNPQTQIIIAQYAPTSMTVSAGTLSSGSFTNLETNNASYANIASTTSGTRTTDWYATTTISQTPSSVTKLTVTYDGKQSRSNVTQKVYLFNYSTGAWNQIDSRTVSTTDITVTYSPATPTNYISVTGLIRLRVLSTHASASFTTNADYVHYTVEAPAVSPIAVASSDEPIIVAQSVPSAYSLEQNYPNPFNPSTTIRYYLPEATTVRLTVFDVLGKEVAVLVDGGKSAGYHAVSFSANNLPSGVYLYRLQTPSYTGVKKFILMK